MVGLGFGTFVRAGSAISVGIISPALLCVCLIKDQWCIPQTSVQASHGCAGQSLSGGSVPKQATCLVSENPTCLPKFAAARSSESSLTSDGH